MLKFCFESSDCQLKNRGLNPVKFDVMLDNTFATPNIEEFRKNVQLPCGSMFIKIYRALKIKVILLTVSKKENKVIILSADVL